MVESSWAEYGLAGLVIFALFMLVLFVMKQHHSERGQWREDVKHIANGSKDALDRLTDAIRDKKI
jgi:hypothetical protein